MLLSDRKERDVKAQDRGMLQSREQRRKELKRWAAGGVCTERPTSGAPKCRLSESTGAYCSSQGLAELCGRLWLRGRECLARPGGEGGEQQVLAPHAGC